MDSFKDENKRRNPFVNMEYCENTPTYEVPTRTEIRMLSVEFSILFDSFPTNICLTPVKIFFLSSSGS